MVAEPRIAEPPSKGLHQTRRGATAVLALLALCSAACSNPSFSQEAAESLVTSVGAERLTAAAESLRPLLNEARQWVELRRWPDPIRELKPENVSIDRKGVWVSKRTEFVNEEGLLILFRGGVEPDEGCCNPFLARVGKGVFWFSITD